jgi:hypothetical protein
MKHNGFPQSLGSQPPAKDEDGKEEKEAEFPSTETENSYSSGEGEP